MNLSFDEALKVWAKKYLEKESGYGNTQVKEVLKVEVQHSEADGYCETCYTDERLTIEITYLDSADRHREFWEYEFDKVYIGQFQLLQELFGEEG